MVGQRFAHSAAQKGTTDTETDRETDKVRHRETDGQRNRQAAGIGSKLL